VSFSALTDIINAVAPPISEHEVLKVSISHEMPGYEGVESIVFQALSKVWHDRVEIALAHGT
jgi:hypothetical protein